MAAIREHRAQTRYALFPEQSREIAHLAKEQGGLRVRDIQYFQKKFDASSKPIHKVLEDLSLPVIGATHDSPRPATLRRPKPKTTTAAPVSDGIEELREKLKREIANAKKAKAKASEETAHAIALQEKAREAIKNTAELRKRTAEERRAVDDLLEERERLHERIRAIEHMDPNTPQFVADLSGLLGHGKRSDKRKRVSSRVVAMEGEMKGLRAELDRRNGTPELQGLVQRLEASNKRLKTQNLKLQEALEATARVSLPDNTDAVQGLPLDALEPLFVALHLEIERRKNGGRRKWSK